MSTAGEEHHRSHGAGHVILGLFALALAATAAYLWLSDGNRSWPMLLKPAMPSSAAEIAPAAPQTAALPARAVLPRTVQRLQPQAQAPAPAPAAEAASPVDPSGPVDAQVAADAAAVGMTSRVRPSQPSTPGQ
jgi:hypothetical protein